MKPKIIRVNNNSAMEKFLAVPSQVYGEGDIPPTASVRATRMRFAPLVNTTLRHLRYANFVALDGERPVGRITASIDNLNPRQEEGFWGCFECIDDPEVAGALLDAAADWLRENKKEIMIGPATLNTNEQVGLLIKGFEYEPHGEIPYNPPYYQKLIESAGLAKSNDLECFKWKLPESLPEKLERAQKPDGVTIRSINYAAIFKEAQIIKEINNKAMARIWGFIPLTTADAQGFLMSLATHVPAKLFIIVEVEGKPAGMMLAIPYKKPDKRGSGGVLRLAIGGIVPEFQLRGIHWLVLKEFYRRCKELGYSEGEASQVAESNEVVKRRIIRPMFGGEVIKLYRVYRRELS
jgi:GNAT superfamily N-acetyltransferase